MADSSQSIQNREDDSGQHNREQDIFLPIANVTRLMKDALPKEAKIGKEAKDCMQESVSEFIAFITSEASDKCATEKRKTINGDDILWAMQSLGFDSYLEPLKIYLQKYRNAEKPPTRKSDSTHWEEGAFPYSLETMPQPRRGQ